MTVREALENGLTMLESLGIQSGDVHDYLRLAIDRLDSRPFSRKVMDQELEELP